MSEALLVLLNELNYNKYSDNATFRTKNNLFFKKVVSKFGINDIKYVIKQLEYYGLKTHASYRYDYYDEQFCKCKRKGSHMYLRKDSFDILISVAQSNTIDVVKWLLDGIDICKA